MEERERQELQEATFRPWITSKASEQYGQGAVGLAERNMAWQENRVKKIEQMKAMLGEQPRKELEVEECTFRPKINRGERKESLEIEYGPKGVDRYIMRMKSARLIK